MTRASQGLESDVIALRDHVQVEDSFGTNTSIRRLACTRNEPRTMSRVFSWSGMARNGFSGRRSHGGFEWSEKKSVPRRGRSGIPPPGLLPSAKGPPQASPATSRGSFREAYHASPLSRRMLSPEDTVWGSDPGHLRVFLPRHCKTGKILPDFDGDCGTFRTCPSDPESGGWSRLRLRAVV